MPAVTGSILLGIAAFVAMEPLTALVHRGVMHGAGLRLHRSHHRRWPSRRDGDAFLEANDVFPVAFAGVAIAMFGLGFQVDALAALVPIAVGVTAYGAAYALVHDVAIHGRLPIPGRRRGRLLAHLADAHALHHRFNGAPYGMLVPIVPASVRERAATADARRPSAPVASPVAGPVTSRVVAEG